MSNLEKKDEGLPYLVVGGTCILILVFRIVYLRSGDEKLFLGLIKPGLGLVSFFCFLALFFCIISILFFGRSYCIYESKKGGSDLIKKTFEGECLRNPSPKKYEDGRNPKIREELFYLIIGCVYLVILVAISYPLYLATVKLTETSTRVAAQQ